MSEVVELQNICQSQVQIAGPGGNLHGKLFEPAGGEFDGSVVINNATGVPARYYAHFAKWLSEHSNQAVLIWDYRDFGASGDPRRSSATMSDWGIEDSWTVRNWMHTRYSELPLWMIGHSLGGLTLPFQPDLDQIDRVTTVASGPVHLSDHPWPQRFLVGTMWYGHGPILTKLLGHFPGKRLGLGSDIPGPVYWQWRRWCSRRGSVLADPASPPLASSPLRAPVTIVAMADDALVPPQAVWRLADWMRSAPVVRRLIDPRDHGLKRIGHIEIFSPRCRAAWPALVAE